MLLKMRSTRSFAHHFIHYVTTRLNLISHYIPVGIQAAFGACYYFLGLTTHVIPWVDLFRFELADPIHGSPFFACERGDYQIL